ncbi:LamG-like jellyroll fold domain-containing protein [Nonomuraea sp. NPDC002799]
MLDHRYARLTAFFSGLVLLVACHAVLGGRAAASTEMSAAPRTVTPSPLVVDTENAALAEAARTGQNVEIASLRGESSEVYATSQGHLQAVKHLRPVRSRVGGEWKAIDTGLERRPDGSVGPKVAAVEIAFSGGGDQPLITLERAGRKLSLSWPAALPAPSIAGDTATYPEVLPGVDLLARADVDGASEVLVVKTAAAAADPRLAELRLAMDSGGMMMSRTPDGGFQAVDPGAGGVVFEAPKPMMWDSGAAGTATAQARAGAAAAPAQAGTVPDASAGPGDSAKVAPIGVALASGGRELVLTPDQGLLENARYPVYIDPKVSSPVASSWTMASRYWASSPQWKFNGDSDAGVGYCADESRCAPADVKRLFYQVPTSEFIGKKIVSAEFVVRETHAYSCEPRNVELWRTKGISSSTTWNSQLASGFWIDKLQTVNTAHGYGSGCAAGDVEFWAGRAVQEAAAHGWTTTTFGIRASDENDPYGWKRFSDHASLRVEYNRPPAQISMSQLTSQPGGACGKAGAPKYVRSLPKLTANNVTDPDDEAVAVQFAANWDSGDGKGSIMRWASALSTYKQSGSDFEATLPASVPKNKVIGWYARSYDKAEYSPWSWAGSATTCWLIYDTSVPAGPAISSGQYPASDPENPADPWTDGVGRYGSFAIDSASTDVVKYWFGINDDPSSAHTVSTSGGGVVSVKFMPTKPGVNYVTAQAFDTAGNGSQITRYQFRVRAGQPERLSLGLDEQAGASSVGGTGGAWVADLHGGAHAGGAGVGDTATGVHLDGADGYAATAAPVLNTGKSFAVSVWARLPAQQPTQPLMALSQSGQYTSGFQLYYSPTSGGWVFGRFTSDNQAGQGLVTASQPSCPVGDTACAASRLATWTHVAGVFDNTNKLLKLYVNGTLAATAPFSGPWDARGQTVIGAGAQNGTFKSFFSGDLDEAQFFDNQLPADQIARLAAKQPVTSPQRPAKVVWSFDEDAKATSLTGHGQLVEAVLHGSPRLGGPAVTGTGMNLDGVDDRAVTTQPVLDTYQSFAVSLWAQPAVEDRVSVAAHQAGAANRGFEVYHNSTGWVFQRAASDTAGAPLVRAVQNACPAGSPTCAAARLGEWSHVVAVYDIDTAQMRLYVNGVLVATEAFTTPWLATGPITLGASNYPTGLANFFKGDLDDVRFFDRAVSVDEVRGLFAQYPVVKGRWQLDSSSGSPVTSPDASAGNRPVTLFNGAKIDTGWVDGRGLNLDGVDDYAATSGVPIDTSRSFTVTAWALASGARPTKEETVISQEGSVNSGFSVRYVPGVAGTGAWRIVMPETDTTAAATAGADNTNFDDFGSRGWNHLALAYDSFAGRMSLYVNGQLQQLACPDSDGDGTQDDAACADGVSWASNMFGFNATKSLQLGRVKTNGVWSGNWSGSIDDVWAFQGVLSQTQIQQLAAGTRGMPTTVPGAG